MSSPRQRAPVSSPQRLKGTGLVALLLLLAGPALAQERGFAVHRYDGTSAGSSHFLVERPWYSSVRLLAVGVTGDYSRRPLTPRVATGRGPIEPIISLALVGHVDLAASLFDRVQLSASLPVTFFETGTPELVSQVSPLEGIGVGDPRFGLLVRLAGQPDQDAISLHLGASVWVPLGTQATHQGDSGLRVMPRVVLAGAVGAVGRWTLDAAFLYRPYASLGPPSLGMTAASEARIGLALGASLFGDRVYVGPEAQFAAQVVGANAFAVNGMNLELLGSLQVLIAGHLLLGVAGGSAFLGAAGTPDARLVVRLAWAPRKTPERDVVPVPDPTPTCPPAGCVEPDGDDPDHDGVPTAVDRCPFEPETRNGVRDADGCPEYELGSDTALARVLAPAANPSPPIAAPSPRADGGLSLQGANRSLADAGTPLPSPRGADAGLAQALARADAGAPLPLSPVSRPDAGAVALPLAGEPATGLDRATLFAVADADLDGVADVLDRCPVAPEDLDDFEDEDGCPELDNDQDGVTDADDKCPLVAENHNGIEDEDGCPDVAPDADQDGVADSADRCPFEAETLNGLRDDDGCPEASPAAPTGLAQLLAPEVAASASLATGTAPASQDAASQPVTGGDADADGIPDHADRCPLQPEDHDGFEDDDGCPELDNDDDGIADTADRCPDEGETFNGRQDDDGCPDQPEDVDGDGVAFEQDRCPFEPGSPLDGCPHAPAPALALAGFSAAPAAAATKEPSTTDPAPATPAAASADFDRDGVPDEADSCPTSPEDRDDFEDEDGCPELDNDRDGIPDAEDKCPFVAETINGIKDTDGCPDTGAGAVTVTASEVVIKGVVRFKTGSATLEARSLPLIKQVASTLRAAASLSVEIRGHTDDVGNAARNIDLSKRRAETIRQVLIKAGVDGARLVANGYGPTRPVASNKTPQGREQNRRVEFLILGESK